VAQTATEARASIIAVLAFSFSIIIITGVGAQTGLDGCVLPLAGTPIDVWLKRISATAGTIG
jgi:hypothetical protein